MTTYNGDNGNNYKQAVQEWDDGSWWNPFDGSWVWNSWTMNGKGGNDTLIGGLKNDTLHGNEGNDSLQGDGGDDYLYGDNNDDSLYGGSGRDVLYGGNGHDLLDGGPGSDSMYGGSGNDTYYVGSTTDLVTEYFNQGLDIVISSISYSLGDNLEYLILQNNSSATNGSGNELDNLILAQGSLNNNLYGYEGNDTLYGNDGNDTISGGGGNDYLYGMSDNDSLVGGIDNDTLVGGGGSDTLTGGIGADTFVFYSPSEGIDTITDFAYLEGDKLQVSASGFGIGVGDYSKFSFDSSTGALSFDGTQFASIQLGSGFVPEWDINIV